MMFNISRSVQESLCLNILLFILCMCECFTIRLCLCVFLLLCVLLSAYVCLSLPLTYTALSGPQRGVSLLTGAGVSSASVHTHLGRMTHAS